MTQYSTDVVSRHIIIIIIVVVVVSDDGREQDIFPNFMAIKIGANQLLLAAS